MPDRLFASACISLLMAAASVAAWVATPTVRIADARPAMNVERLIPTAFGDWRTDDTIAPVQADPTVQAQLDKIYAQTVSRTYVDRDGQRVMLVIAYGGEQSDALGVHKPEVCYPAQGFEILRNQQSTLDTGFGQVPVSRLVARQSRRYEPITYWIRVGDAVDGSGLQRKLTQMKYGITGLIPDGVLFRVSSIGPDEEAFALQRRFARDLLSSLDAGGRAFVLGKLPVQAPPGQG
jgi:EpsI family protein